ncbi:CMD domain protein [Nocardiopsis alba]|uniref:CMD domain protein n=1 Tax=Nocardiopsis alba TaxID=53437 RepID=UPI0033C8A8A1
MTDDLVDRLLDITPGSPLDRVRAARPEARANARLSHRALIEPAGPGGVPHATRALIAVFVATLHEASRLGDHYEGLARERAGDDAANTVIALGERARAHGPAGRHREDGLVDESTDGPTLTVSDPERALLGEAVATALEHAHLLVLRPREAGPDDLRALAAAGWTTTDIVTLSQLVSFLAFQIRLVHGLEALSTRTEDARS